MGKEELLLPPCFADCQNLGDSIKFSLGSEVFEIRAEPSEHTEYEICLLKQASEGDGSEVLFNINIELTPEEYSVAVSSSINDRSIFMDNIDGLMSQRVARDLFTYFLLSVAVKSFNDRMNKIHFTEWGNYLKYLIHERMEGRSISVYNNGIINIE